MRIFAALLFLVVVTANSGPQASPPLNYISGLGLYCLDLKDQATATDDMLGSVAISGSQSSCGETALGSTVEDSIYDTLGESFTVEAWIKHPTPDDGTYRSFLARHPTNNQGNEAAEWNFQLQKEGNINFFTGCGNNWQYGFNVGLKSEQFPSWRNYTLAPNTWTHVAAAVDWQFEEFQREIGFVRLYVDGELIDEKPWATDDEVGACTGRRRTRAPGQPVRIGYYDNSDTGVQTFGGLIDEVRIWNEARTQKQIQDYMHGPLFDFDKTNLLSYHSFNEGLEGIFPLANPILQGRYSWNVAGNSLPCVVGHWNDTENSLSHLPWARSTLKIHNAPITTVLGSGSTTGELLGVDCTTADYSETFDFWITGLQFTTDATAYYYKDNKTRTLLSEFPVQVPNGLRIEYVPGTTAGIDSILYEARFNGTAEPSFLEGLNKTTDCCRGPAKMTFEVLCPLVGGVPQVADRCGVCGGDNSTQCACNCDGQGSRQDLCGRCNVEGMSDCRGCDCVPYSGAVVDSCGKCGGSDTTCGSNVTECTEFLDVKTTRLDLVLLSKSMDQILSRLDSLETLLTTVDSALPGVATDASNSVLSAQILALNSFCESAGQFSQSLDEFIPALDTQFGPCGALPQWPCSASDFPF